MEWIARAASVDLETLVLNEQGQFVLKPNDDYGGHGAVLGWETGLEEWCEAVKAAFHQPYVVQERMFLEKTMIQAYSDRVYLDQLFVDSIRSCFRTRSRER